MGSDILQVKTSIPPPGRDVLMRPRILEHLEEDLYTPQGFTRRLTLACAPAGFGKTTLVRTWVATLKHRTAWYSLDEEDNERARFWTYLASALQKLNHSTKTEPLEVLRAGGVFGDVSDAESLLTPLLNDLFDLDEPTILVLDDYHLVSDSQVHRDMVFFLENLPPNLHVVVTTRSAPPWPLSRWRARGAMVEVGLQELRFSRKETGELLTGLRGLHLDESQLDTLYAKTEGWPTGLHLAGVSLSSCRRVDDFVAGFAGSQRHVLHFLSDEVFATQPGPVRDFLLRTAILNRFCAPLCDAVTGRNDSSSVLANLERDNLFLIGLDEQGLWYRYHSLFRDLLTHYLGRDRPEEVKTLHDRARRWFVEADEPGQAVHHALQCGSHEKVGQTLHDHYDRLLTENPGLLNSTIDDLPEAALRHYPRLAAHSPMLDLLYRGKDAARASLAMASELTYDHDEAQREYAGMLAAVQGYYRFYCHELTPARQCVEEALELLPPHNRYWRMAAAVCAGDIAMLSGDPGGAHPFYLQAHRASQGLGNHFHPLVTGFKVAASLLLQGRLREAGAFARATLHRAEDAGLSRVPRIGLLWTLLGEVHRERGDLQEAERLMDRGILLSKPERLSLGYNLLSQAALFFSQGKLEQALDVLSQIEALNLESQLPLFVISEAAFLRARVLLAQGEAYRARRVLSRAGISEEVPMQDGQERGYLVLVRALLSDARSGTHELLGHIATLVARKSNRRLTLEAILTRAHVEEMMGRLENAEDHLKSALELAMGSGHLQVFLDEGRELLPTFSRLTEKMRDLSRPGDADVFTYARKVHRALAPGGDPTRQAQGATGSEAACARETALLSTRQLEVLVLITQGLSNEDISEELVISVATVKWHASNIYSKLQVRGRTAAAARARELGLVP